MKRIKNGKNKGFTLIELLAVIVILGLLMAIAIPSVTRYITQSRKKTLITTIGNYVGALGNEVNSFEYTFTNSNTVYAVPIECIALERGGNNPFGEWKQANDKYWAYILVQYDDVNSSYRYGFTFKDSAGYGIYPTAQSKLSNNDKNIKTGLNLTRPQNGKVTTITDINNWGESGFAVATDTNLVVLVSESEGKVGNGITTCTLQQKGSNYAQVEKEKEENKEEELKGEAYALLFENDSLIFVRSETPIKAGDTYNSKTYGNISVEAAYTGFETETYSTKQFCPFKDNTRDCVYVLDTPWSENSVYITDVVVEDKVRFASMDALFSGFVSLEHADIGNIDISKNTSLNATFRLVGYFMDNNSGCHLAGGSWEDCHLGGGNTQIIGLEKWDTSNITDMSGMFIDAGISSIDNIANWDTSNVTSMADMFAYSSAGVFAIPISNWDTSSVTTMRGMFAQTYSICNLDLSNWNTSKVTDMVQMFSGACGGGDTFYLNLSNWNVSNVGDMFGMFHTAGSFATTFNIKGINTWDTSNVTSMNGMFYHAGFNATYSLDLSGWNVDKVTLYGDFNSGVESKVTPPKWKN